MMIRPLPRHTAAVLLALSFSAIASASLAADPAPATPAAEPDANAVEEAGRRYDRGLKFYAEGEYRLAVIEFERTYELVPDYRVLYNIGQVRIQLSDYARARIALERYLREGAGQIKADREQAVKNDLEMLGNRTATLKLVVEPAGVEVLIDGQSVGTTPLAEPVLLNAGEHNVELRKPGFQGQVLRRTLAGSDQGELAVTLEALPADSAPAGALAETPKPIVAPRSTTAMWIGWAVTGGLAAGAITTGILGNKAADDLDDKKDRRDADPADLQSTSNKAKMLLTVSDALTAGAVVAGGVSLYLTLRSPSKSDTSDQARVGLNLSTSGIRLVGQY
jgi:tetratricopeptide (TPR) repeat protein